MLPFNMDLSSSRPEAERLSTTIDNAVATT
jgi:hypothetical protein